MAFFTEGCCFRATPLSHHDGVLVLRTVDQEKAKEELEARLAAIVAMRGVVVPPQQKPPFVAGDIWLQANSGCWERVMLAHNQPKDRDQGSGLFMDRNVLVKLDRNGSCYRVPYCEVQSVSEMRIPPIFCTMLVDSSYKLDEQLTDGKSLFDLIVDGTEIMCLVRRIDPLKKIPVVVWYPSTKTPWFERQMTLNPFALPTAESEQVVKGEVSDVVVVWLTADRTGEADYSVVLGRIDDGCGDSGENSSSPFRRFRQRQTEIERMATNMAPWDWESHAPPVGTRLLYECDGVRKSPTSIGPEWVRAVVTSVDFDDAADSWLVVVSLPDLGNRNFVLTGMANLKRRLRYNCNTNELDKFDREPPVPVSMCRLQGYHVAGDRRFDKEGFACLAKMRDIVVFFGDTVVDTLGNVIHETAMKGTDFRRKESDRCIDVGPILARADLLSECDGESLPTIATMTKKWEARLQFPVGTDAALGWPQNRSLSNRLQKVQVVRANRAEELVVQLLNDDTRRMLRSLAAIYKTDVLCNIPMAELPCDRQLACIVHLDLHRFAPYSDGIFPRCAQKDGKMLARALVLRGVENKRREVYFYAVDMDLTGWISIDSVYYMPDLPALHIGAAAIQCRMNVVGGFLHVQHIKKILMTEELFAAFGPVTKCPKTDRRVVWLMRESFLLIDEMLTRSNVWSQTEKGAAKPPFSLLLVQEQLDESTPNLRGRFLYEIVKPNFDSSAYHSDDSFRFQVKCTENPSEPTALKLEDAARKTAVTGFLQPPHAGKCVRAVATKSKVELLDMATEEGAMKTMKVLPVEPQWLGLLRLLPKLVVSSRIVGLHPSAHSLLSKLPLSNDRLDQHLHITPLIAPVSSTEDPGGPIYSSRLFLRLRDGKRYDVAAMLTAWESASKWEQEQRYLTITESRLRETSRSFYAEAEWPTAVGRRILCESPLSNLSVVFLMPADFRNWLDAIFNRCQELRHSGQAERLRREQLCLGMACLALFLDNYYRAEVVKLCGETVTVFFVDYGNTHEVTAAGVFRATPDLLAIPKLVLFAQELDYAPTDQQSFGLSDGYGDYVAMLKKMVFAELKAGPLLGGYYDVALYTPSWSNRQASLRLMDKLRFEHKCCVNVDAAERRARIMLTPQIDFKQRRPCTHPNSPARFCRLACVVNPRHLYVVGEDEEQPWQSASERLRLTRVASDRIWPGRLLGAAVERRYRRVVVLKVNEEMATADVGLVDNGDRIEVRLDSLVELAPYDAPCRLVRVMLDGVVGNYSFPIDFNANATSKLNEWLEQKRSVRINWKRVEEVDGVPVFVVDLKADDEDALAALHEQPPIPPVIRKAQSPNSCDPFSSSQQQSCSSLPLSNSPLL